MLIVVWDDLDPFIGSEESQFAPLSYSGGYFPEVKTVWQFALKEHSRGHTVRAQV